MLHPCRSGDSSPRSSDPRTGCPVALLGLQSSLEKFSLVRRMTSSLSDCGSSDQQATDLAEGETRGRSETPEHQNPIHYHDHHSEPPRPRSVLSQTCCGFLVGYTRGAHSRLTTAKAKCKDQSGIMRKLSDPSDTCFVAPSASRWRFVSDFAAERVSFRIFLQSLPYETLSYLLCTLRLASWSSKHITY